MLSSQRLARMIHEARWLRKPSAVGGPTPALAGLRSGLALSKVRSTASKPAAAQVALLQARMNACEAFMNKAGRTNRPVRLRDDADRDGERTASYVPWNPQPRKGQAPSCRDAANHLARERGRERGQVFVSR